MADITVSSNIDTFMQSADKAAMRTNMDLGTAATKDVAATGDAAAGEVVKGDDTRLTDARTPTSHTHTASEVTDFDTEVSNNVDVAANTSKLAGIEAGAEANNISDVNATDLTDGGDSTLHYHSADRARANHTGTQTLSTISDAGTIASQNANSVTITGGSITGITDLAIADGGTGASTAAGARTNLDVYSTAEVDEYLAPKATAGGVRFDGVVGDILTEFQYPIDTDATFSITFSTESVGYPLTFCRTSNTTGRAIEFQVESGGTVLIWFFDASLNAKYRISGINFLDGVLRTITVTVSGTTLAFYVNGSSVSATFAGGTFTGFVSGNYRYSIASRRAAAVNQFMELTCIDFTIFNRALSASEVADLYRNGLAGIADADRWGSGVSVTGTTTAGFQITDNGGTTTSWDFTATATPGIYEIRDLPLSVVAGQKYLCKGSVTTLPATGDLQIFLAQAGVPISNIVTLSSTGSFSEVLTITTTSTVPRIYIRILNGTGSTTVGTIDGINQLGAIAAYPMDEGIGYQLHDISSNHYDGLLSTSGFTHLLPKTEGKVRVKAADASSAMYMLRAGDIIPTNSIVDNVLSEQCFVDLTNSAQTLDDYRVRLNPSGSDLEIQRSDGSNHQTLGTVTAPASLSNVDVEVQYKQVIR